MVSSESGKFIPFFDEIGPPWITRVVTRFGSTRERRRDLFRGAFDRVGRDDELRARLELNHAVDFTDPQLRPLNVADDRNVAAELRGDVANDRDDLRVLLVFAVGEVEAEGVDSAGEESMDHVLAAAGGAEGGQDFRAAHKIGA
jgi:hypothetical protein